MADQRGGVVVREREGVRHRPFTKGPGGVLEVFMTGGSDGASYCKPKKIHKPEILDPKKYLASKFPNQKNTRFKYLNTDLFT